MPRLRRRSLLAAGAASLVAHGLPAFAASAPYGIKHGAFEVTVVTDGYWMMPTSSIAPEAPVVERDALLKLAGKTGDQFEYPTCITLLRTPSDLILVDMGSGDRFMPTTGKLWDNLKAAGIDKAKISKVIFTHGHPDHLWGAVDELVTPEAAFYVAQAEWDFWTGENALRGLPAERAGAVTGARRNYAAIKQRVKMLKPGDDVVTGVRVIDTPGPYPGPCLTRTRRPRWANRRRRCPPSPADFVPTSGVEANRRPCAGSGSANAEQAARSDRRRPLQTDRLSSAIPGRGDGRAQGWRLPVRAGHLAAQ